MRGLCEDSYIYRLSWAALLYKRCILHAYHKGSRTLPADMECI